jgi:hypothetical protein
MATAKDELQEFSENNSSTQGLEKLLAEGDLSEIFNELTQSSEGSLELRQTVARRMLSQLQETEEEGIRPELTIQGESAGYNPSSTMATMGSLNPDYLYGRAGLSAPVGPGRISGGLSGSAVRMPRGEVQYYSGDVDLGYRMPLGGGELSLGAAMPIEPQQGKRPVRLNANYVYRFQEGGEVTGQAQPPMSDYLFPNRARDYTPPPKSTASMDLARMGKQAGLVGAGFLPGAGVADYFGQFPSVEGGTEPSAVQNFQQGNYGTAALQGLGAMGDLAMTIPVAGAAIGSVMKAPRAAQRMLKELPVGPKVSDEGFYSQVEKALLDNPQQKGTGDQFLAQIQKTPGVKPEELQYTGLDTFLAGKPSVTKAEIQGYLDENRVQVQEVRLDKNANPYGFEYMEDFDMAIARAERLGDWDEADRLTQAAEAFDGLGTAGQTKYHLGAMSVQTEIPGGTNYREVLLTLPNKVDPTDLQITGSGNQWYIRDANNNIIEAFGSEKEALSKLKNRAASQRSKEIGDTFISSHFDQPNILAHMRLNDRVVDGKPTLFVEEIQSDWHQAGRKKGYETGVEKTSADLEKELIVVNNKISSLLDEAAALPDSKMDQFIRMNEEISKLSDESTRLATAWTASLNRPKGVPDAPFKTSWHELTLKKALNEASTKGYDQIAFTTGKTQADRYGQTKKIESVALSNNELRAYDKAGKMVIRETGVTPDDVSRLIGAETAEKLLRQAPDDSLGLAPVRSLLDLNLSIGGEGMKGFYDNILPKSLDKIGKKYGTKVRKTMMDTPEGPVEVWAMDIPPEMRETISSQGQPLFQIGAGAAGAGAAGTMLSSDEETVQNFRDGGEVQPYMGDYVFPNRPRDYVSPSSTTSAEDLKRFGKQAGLLGLGFAPGAGMADYFGQFPSVEGGTEPSAVQNFQQGNYGTAALQGLGAMGDLMYAVPVLGATVGSAMKGPRAAQKMLRELSPAEQAIPSADVILEKAKEVEGLCDFMNCKLFSQMVSGIPEITNLPKVDKAQVGDIYAWPNGTHYAVDIGDGKVIEVEEWGEAPRVISMSDVIKELDPPESILRPPPGTYTPKKVESSALPSKAKKELNELIEQAPRATDQGSRAADTKGNE